MPTTAPASFGLPRPRRQPAVKSNARSSVPIVEPGELGFAWVFGFVAVHMALALLMKQVHTVAGVHAFGTLAVGLWICFGRNRLLQLAQWAGYTVGAEALWRMCGAAIPWEFAKLSICLVFLISIIHSNDLRRSWLPLLYLALLVPGALMTFVLLPFGEARQQVSFYIAPPAALALCAIRFSTLRLTPVALQRIGVAIIAPIAGMGMIALFGIATSPTQFGTVSNSAASGGYGPNQVSSMLSLGAVLAVFLCLGTVRSLLLRGGFAALALWLLAQAVLTYSRTGLYLFAGAVGIAAVFLIQSKGRALKFLLLTVVFVAAIAAVLPMLDAFTGGTLIERFKDQRLTGRDTIAQVELQMWLQKPVFGNGVGMSMYNRSAMSGAEAAAAHTEYTRLLAEHGLLGAGALAVLLIMVGQTFLRTRGAWGKAVVASFAVWSFLFMAGTAMRLVAPAFLLGLIHARFLADKPGAISASRFARGSALPAQVGGYPATPRGNRWIRRPGRFGK